MEVIYTCCDVELINSLPQTSLMLGSSSFADWVQYTGNAFCQRDGGDLVGLCRSLVKSYITLLPTSRGCLDRLECNLGSWCFSFGDQYGSTNAIARITLGPLAAARCSPPLQVLSLIHISAPTRPY